MVQKLALILAVLALIASAGTPLVGGHYSITLFEPVALQGNILPAGEYRLSLADTKVTITQDGGKNPLALPVKVEMQDKKFDSTSVEVVTVNGKAAIGEIRLGGTKIKLVFN